MLETQHALDLVVIFLEVNDWKRRFDAGPFNIAQGASQLVGMVQRSLAGPDDKSPQVLLICPPPVKVLTALAGLFEGAIAKSPELASHYAWQVGRSGCEFLDAGEIVSLSPLDGIHLDEEAHRILGAKVAEITRTILSK